MANTLERLEVPGDEALLDGKLDGLVAAVYENERPLLGLAGLLDWCTHGMISRFLMENSIRGDEGELSYLPVRRRERTLHLFLIGLGAAPQPGERRAWSADVLQRLKKNLPTSGVARIGISLSDCATSEQTLAQSLAGGPFWLVQ